MEIQKIQMAVQIFSGFAYFAELKWVYRGFESLCSLLTSNKVPFDFNTIKRVQVEILSMLKLVSFESLPRKLRLTAIMETLFVVLNVQL